MQVNNEFTKLSASNLNFFYGSKQVLKNISLSFNKKEITALIGPSGCGKSTFLRTLNRMNDLIEGALWKDQSNSETRKSIISIAMWLS